MAGGSTAAQVIERLAEVTGALRSRFDRLARALREDDPSNWPEGSAGRGRAGIPTPEQMVNLIIAEAAADPYSMAPAVVRQYAVMVLTEQQGTYTEPAADDKGQIASASVTEAVPQQHRLGLLRTALAGLICNLAEPSMRELIRSGDYELLLTMGSRPRAAFSRKGTPGWSTEETTGWRTASIYEPPQSGLSLTSSPAGEIVRTARIPFAVFETLGKLWEITEAHRKPAAMPTPCLPLSEPVSPNTSPETENADPSPKGPAPIRDQTDSPKARNPAFYQEHTEAMRVSEKSQAPSSRRPGRSPLKRIDPDDRRHDSAFASRA